MNIVNAFQKTVTKYPHKIAFVYKNEKISFSELNKNASGVACYLLGKSIKRKPIIVYLDKGISCITAFVGIEMSGNYYSPIDSQMPLDRIKKIIDTLDPAAVITNKDNCNSIQTIFDGNILCLEEITSIPVEIDKINTSVNEIISEDPAYVLFTSGSTGVPKGVVVSHRALFDFVEWASNEFSLNETTVFANQVPFYFSMCIWDIYLTLCYGCCCHIIPPEMFMFPATLMEYLSINEINTLVWVPSALICVVNLKALKAIHIDTLRHVFFGGEAMPSKKLNKWIAEYPTVRFTNIYGPTEVSDTFMYYTLSRPISDNEPIPIGILRKNHQIMIINNDGEMASEGELYVRGAGLASGYYNNPDQTQRVFIQNPLNKMFKDTVYKTGDWVKYNQYGELIYVSRKDSQIKHMGQRIELGEIETAMNSIDGIDECCCLYNTEKSQIVVYYSGELMKESIRQKLEEIIPSYMVPSVLIKLCKMPHNLNGKVDRSKIKEIEDNGRNYN